MAGWNGSVDIESGDRACAYAVYSDGTQYAGSKGYPKAITPTSYRSELEGILGVTDIANESSITKIEPTCDYKASVEGVQNELYNLNQMLALEDDILLACQKRRRESDIDFEIEWVKGHQDNRQQHERGRPYR